MWGASKRCMCTLLVTPCSGLAIVLVRDDVSRSRCAVWPPGSSVEWLVLCCVAVPQELNNRLAAEITRLRTLLTGDGGGEASGSPLTQGKDAYELEVL